jgi:hypothetical protein
MSRPTIYMRRIADGRRIRVYLHCRFLRSDGTELGRFYALASCPAIGHYGWELEPINKRARRLP